jgi:hypothetical protein
VDVVVVVDIDGAVDLSATLVDDVDHAMARQPQRWVRYQDIADRKVSGHR